MVVKELEKLTEEDRDLVLRTPALIAVLISGADGDFSQEEQRQAFRAVHFRGIQGEELLFDYYKVVDHSFKSALEHIKQKYSGTPDERAEKIGAKLAELSNVLPKLDKIYANVLLDNWKSLAKSIAKAEGGIFGYASISYEESQLINLEMISF